MRQQPRNYKYLKQFKKRFFKNKKLAYRPNTLKFGYYGLKSTTYGTIEFKHLEAGRKAINQKLKRSGKIWIRILPILPITTTPISTRMGKGKGAVSSWIYFVKPGTIIYEINNITETKAREVLKKAAIKLPFQTKIIKKKL